MSSPAAYPSELPLRRAFELAVDGGHVLQVREAGDPHGLPVVVLHGGPGSGSSPLLWSDFDPARWRLIVPDQRGAGLSRPRGQWRRNDTAALLADLRRLRRTLGLARWWVAGGSWGATLALAHALDEPGAVAGLLLRAPFLARREDIDGFFAMPAGAAASPAGQALRAAAGEVAGGALLESLHQVLLHGEAAAAEAASLAWAAWERERAGRPPLSGAPPSAEALRALVDRYRVQIHYLRQACWLDGEAALLARLTSVPRVPTVLLHGRDDRICPPEGARALHDGLPGSRLVWIDGVGHDAGHPAMRTAMREATAWLAAQAAGLATSASTSATVSDRIPEARA